MLWFQTRPKGRPEPLGCAPVLVPALWVSAVFLLPPGEFPGDSAHFWGRVSVSTNNTPEKKEKKKKVFCTETFLDSSIKHLRQERSAGNIDVQGSSSAGTAPRSSVSCIFMCKGRHPNTKTVSADVKLKRRSGFLQSEGVNRPPRKPKSPKWSLKIKCMLLNHRWLNAKLVEKLELRFRQI